jgi:hypothetical protein
MASPRTSDSQGRDGANTFRFWSTPDEEIEEISEPTEWSPALLEVLFDSTDDWADLILTRDGERMPLRQQRIGKEVRTVARWPRSGPGNYRMKLRSESGIEAETTISVRPEEIEESGFQALLDDLEAQLPAQVAFAIKQMDGLAGVEDMHHEGDTIEQELIRLRRAVRGTAQRIGLVEAIGGLADRPHQVLTDDEKWVRRGRARRPPPDKLGQAVARPGNVRDEKLRQVPDREVRHTPDVYENRIVRQFLRQVEIRLRRVKRPLQERDEKSGEEVRDLLGEVQQAWKRASFLQKVSELTKPPTKASMTLQNRPLYKAIWKGYLEFQRELRPVLGSKALDAPLKNLPSLYQLWSALNIIVNTLDIARENGSMFRKTKKGFLELDPKGIDVSLKHPGREKRIKIQREKKYSHGKNSDLKSVSYGKIPDLSILFYEGSEIKSVYIFDPKYKNRKGISEGKGKDYKSEAPVRSDVDKMHTYRDSIRSPDGDRIVRYAATLFPGETRKFSNGLHAIGLKPSSDKIKENLTSILKSTLEL